MFESDPSSLPAVLLRLAQTVQGLQAVQAVPWTLLAILSYITTITVGTLSLRGHRIPRRWHSRLFILTCVVTAAAALFSLPLYWGRAILLGLALVPLALLPFLTAPVPKNPRRHIVLGLTAAPCYLGALALWAVQPR